MTDNIKAFLEADALRTQEEWTVGEHVGGYSIDECNIGNASIAEIDNETVNDVLNAKQKHNATFIAAASRIAPDIRNLQAENVRLKALKITGDAVLEEERYRKLLAAFELVCEALESMSPHYDFVDVLSAAAPFRKLKEIE